MSRLINTKEFIKRIDRYPPDIRDTAKKELRYCKTVDAIPVVRCKDCKYAHLTYDGECKYCDAWSDKFDGQQEQLYLSGYFYCSFGERVTE